MIIKTEPEPYGEDWNPTDVLLRGLLASARGEAFDEDELATASMALAAVALISRGVDEDTAIRAVEQAAEAGEIRVWFDGDDGLQVSIGSDS